MYSCIYVYKYIYIYMLMHSSLCLENIHSIGQHQVLKQKQPKPLDVPEIPNF